MEQYEGHLLLGTAEKQETDRVRERNRVAKRASSKSTTSTDKLTTLMKT
jgi:hypothetical protein